MRIVVAPQEFKGTLTADEAAQAMAAGVRAAFPNADVDVLPLADGGPGTVRAIVGAAGGELRETEVRGPLPGTVGAQWGLLSGGTAVIEMAAAAGLVLLSEEQRDPRITTTYGVGQLILAALEAGARRIIVGLGGSATNDGGAGMAQALGARLDDLKGRELEEGGAALVSLDSIDISDLDSRIRETEFVGATDVRNPLCGPEGASVVYGPQKGATPGVARELDDALMNYARVIERDLDVSVAGVPGAGAAGGLGAGLIAFLGASIRPGIDVVAEVVGMRERLRGADLLLTGEGRLDGQTGYGKTVAGVAQIAQEEGVPVLTVPGSLGAGWEAVLPLVIGVEPVSAEGEPLPDDPAAALASAVERALRRWTR